ncbi:hypothetical protein AMECASPLE_024738 [Ameca splendens]|uniref:Uncharacterized protein n=1 Tax=Ameca splendens TaxID=208324 RepID=A0ABV0ZRK2_9TELE
MKCEVDLKAVQTQHTHTHHQILSVYIFHEEGFLQTLLQTKDLKSASKLSKSYRSISSSTETVSVQFYLHGFKSDMILVRNQMKPQ